MPRRRWLRFLLRTIALTLAGAVVLSIGAVVAALHAINAPEMRVKVQRTLREQVGIDLHYARLTLRPLSGLAVEDLRVLSPPPYDAIEPVLLRVGTFQVRWSLRRMIGSRAPQIDEVALRDVALALATDARGDSLSALLAQLRIGREARPAAPPAPLSRLLQDSLPARPPVGRLLIEGITLSRALAPGRRTELRGLRLLGAMRPGTGGPELELELGRATAPLELRLLRADPAGAARGQLHLEARLSGGVLSVSAGLRLQQQDLLRSLPPVAELLRLQGEARFLPGEGRVALDVSSFGLLDEALTASLRAERPDEGGRVRLERADGRLDLRRLSVLVPPELGRLEVGRGQVRWRAAGIVLGPDLRVEPGGEAHAEGQIADLRAEAAGRRISLRRLDLRGRGAIVGSVGGRGGESRLELELPLLGLRIEHGPGALLLDGAWLSATAARRGGAPLMLRASLPASLLALVEGPARRELRDLRAELRASLREGPDISGDLELSVGTLSAPPLALRRLRASVGTPGLSYSSERPLRSRGVLRAALSFGGLQATASLHKKESSADFELDARAPSLAFVRAVAPRSDVPWERMSLRFGTRGTVAGLQTAAPSLTQRAEIDLGQASLPGGGRAERVQAALSSRSVGRRHDGALDLRITGLQLRGQAVGDSQVGGKLELDLAQPYVKLSLDGKGSAGPEGRLALTMDLDRPSRHLRYTAEAQLGRLGLVEPLLPAALRRAHRVTWPQLHLDLRASGEAGGLVRGLTASGRPILVADPVASLTGLHELSLGLKDLRYEGGGRKIDASSLSLKARIEAQTGRRELSLTAAAPQLRVEEADRLVTLGGLRPKLVVASRAATIDGPLQMEGSLELDTLDGRGLPPYPVGGLRLWAAVQRAQGGAWRISELRLQNPRGGTTLIADGGLDLTTPSGGAGSLTAGAGSEAESETGVILGRRSLELRGTLEQDLGRAGMVDGAGQVSLRFQLESPDLQLLHLRGGLGLRGVRLRGGGYRVEGARGQVPVTLDLVNDPRRGLILLGDARPNAYPRLRFADHHPFLTGGSFLAVDRLDLYGVQLGQIAGNARIERNLYAIDQLEMRLRGGVVTGQVVYDRRGADSEVYFRGAATNIRASEEDGDRLDANGVLRFAAGRRSLEGRLAILRIDRRHLLDLLDVLDPNLESVGLNRIRKALQLGHPKHVQLQFADGFGQVRVQIGGLAQVVRVHEVRGVLLAPVIEHFMGAWLRGLEKD